jgi:uncharacterized protein with ParB-like and HNH nuclease domain
MDNSNTLELEILIAVSQNRRVPTHQFSRLFEHKWKLYEAALNELVPEKLFDIQTIDGTPAYELTGKGKLRITELIEQREKDIAIRISNLKNERTLPSPARKSLTGLLNSIAHFWLPSKKITNSRTLSGHH